MSVCEQPIPWEKFLTFQDKYLRGGKASAKTGAGEADLQARDVNCNNYTFLKQGEQHGINQYEAALDERHPGADIAQHVLQRGGDALHQVLAR